jgi:hypothetical protein
MKVASISSKECVEAPDDLVDERGEAGEARGGDKEAPGGASGGGLRQRRRLERAREQPHRRGDGEVQRSGDAQRAGQADPGDEHESACQHAGGGAEAVREVEQRDRPAGVGGRRAHQARAHQRKGRAERERLRQEEQARYGELQRERRSVAAESRQQRGVAPVGEPHEQRMEDERRGADRRLDERVGRERAGESR